MMNRNPIVALIAGKSLSILLLVEFLLLKRSFRSHMPIRMLSVVSILFITFLMYRNCKMSSPRIAISEVNYNPSKLNNSCHSDNGMKQSGDMYTRSSLTRRYSSR